MVADKSLGKPSPNLLAGTSLSIKLNRFVLLEQFSLQTNGVAVLNAIPFLLPPESAITNKGPIMPPDNMGCQ